MKCIKSFESGIATAKIVLSHVIQGRSGLRLGGAEINRGKEKEKRLGTTHSIAGVTDLDLDREMIDTSMSVNNY